MLKTFPTETASEIPADIAAIIKVAQAKRRREIEEAERERAEAMRKEGQRLAALRQRLNELLPEQLRPYALWDIQGSFPNAWPRSYAACVDIPGCAPIQFVVVESSKGNLSTSTTFCVRGERNTNDWQIAVANAAARYVDGNRDNHA